MDADHAPPILAFCGLAIAAAVIAGTGLQAQHAAERDDVASPTATTSAVPHESAVDPARTKPASNPGGSFAALLSGLSVTVQRIPGTVLVAAPVEVPGGESARQTGQDVDQPAGTPSASAAPETHATGPTRHDGATASRPTQPPTPTTSPTSGPGNSEGKGRGHGKGLGNGPGGEPGHGR